MGRTETSRTLEWDSGQIQDYAGSDLGWGVNWYNKQQFWSSMCNNFCVPGESPSIRKLLVEREKGKTTADLSTPLRYATVGMTAYGGRARMPPATHSRVGWDQNANEWTGVLAWQQLLRWGMLPTTWSGYLPPRWFGVCCKCRSRFLDRGSLLRWWGARL